MMASSCLIWLRRSSRFWCADFLLLRVRCEPGISRSSSAILQSPAGCCSPAQKCTYCPCLDHTPHCSVEPVYEPHFGKAVGSDDSQTIYGHPGGSMPFSSCRVTY